MCINNDIPMKILDYIDRINLLHQLIKEQRTGTPEELARRMHLSRSRTCRIIEELKSRGVPIAYSRQSHSYYYTLNYKMQANVAFTQLDDEPAYKNKWERNK